MKNEIEEYLQNSYNRDMVNVIESIILMEFPDIKNLTVTPNGKSISISFNEGKYTREQIETKIQEYKNKKYE